MPVAFDTEIIARHPIGTGLDDFRLLLKSRCDELGISGVEDHESRISQLVLNSEVKDLVLAAFIDLLRTPLAQKLPSRSSSGTLVGDLSDLISQVDCGKFKATKVIPLFEHIDRHASDLSICVDVFELLLSHTSTPPTVSDQLPFDTPFKSTSSSQQANEQKDNGIHERIFQEINGYVFRDTGGFYEKYFEGKQWSPEVERVIEEVNPQVRGGRWIDYPALPSQSAFLEWFWRFQTRFFLGGHCKFYASPELPLAGSDCKRKPDLFLAPSDISKHDGRYDWVDVRVIGELKQSQIRGGYVEELVKFSGHAREVFAAQPTRRFLHTFIIRGSIMELWVFDRSGLYSSETFDIHQDPRQFVKIMFGYTRMNDEELGLNTHIKEDKTGKYILLEVKGKEKSKEKTKGKERLYLEDKPIAFQRAIVCRGTTCYRAKRRDSRRWEYVVKFAWRSDKRQAEGELLKLAKERNVWGAAKLISHQDLEEVTDIRRGLKFNKPQQFRSAKRDFINQSHSRQSATETSPTTFSTSSSGQKRMAEETMMAPPLKRSSLGSRGRPNTTDLASTQLDSAVSTQPRKPQVNSLTIPDIRENRYFENRIFSCLVTSPPGRAVHCFVSVDEFLEACRDFFKAHSSLYHDGKILHRDISENNIIITDAEQEGDPKGMLIDLDLAKELEGGSSGARHRTGTMEFMAFEVLEGNPHTYRHDLESLFYVFLWVIVQGRNRTLPKTSRLRRWYIGSYDQIAEAKRSHMDKKAFQNILFEFPLEFESLKKLAEDLRGLLFPIRDEALFTGTYRDAEQLYKPMIKAFKRAIARYERTTP